MNNHLEFATCTWFYYLGTIAFVFPPVGGVERKSYVKVIGK